MESSSGRFVRLAVPLTFSFALLDPLGFEAVTVRDTRDE